MRPAALIGLGVIENFAVSAVLIVPLDRDAPGRVHAQLQALAKRSAVIV